jgi:Zn-dependent protease with chaperone function
MSTSDSEDAPAPLSALLYDGATTGARLVAVRLRQASDGSMLASIEEGGAVREVPLQSRALRGQVGSARVVLPLPDGSTIEFLDTAAVDAALSAAGTADARGWAHRLEGNWRAALFAVVAIVLGTWGFLSYGVPALATRAMRVIPTSVDADVGIRGLAVLDQSLLGPTKLPEDRQAVLRRAFATLVQDAVPDVSGFRLEFREGRRLGANAFALPSGIVVMTDELVAVAHHDDELRAVLAHEVGHVVHRDAMRMLVQNSATALLMLGLLGDVNTASSLVAAVPTALVNAAYSRDAERDADAFALRWMARHHISGQRMSDLLMRLSQQPGVNSGGFFSSHPGLAERVRRAKEKE